MAQYDCKFVARRCWAAHTRCRAQGGRLQPGSAGLLRGGDPTEAEAIPTPAFKLVPIGNGALNDPDAVAMQAFGSADLQVGGGHLYASVVKYLQTDVAPRRFGADNGTAFTAAGALTEMVGFCLQSLCSRDLVSLLILMIWLR
jgi:hypothetical protein